MKCRALRAEVTTGCRCRMTNRFPVSFASFFNRWLNSKSSPANASWLKPPSFRNAAVSTKMNAPMSNRRQRNPKFTNRVIRVAKKSLSIPTKGRAAGHAIPRAYFVHHVGEQFRAGMGIRVHKDQPVAGRRRRTGIPRTGDLADQLEHNGCSRRPRNFRRPVIGVIVADDQFGFPSASRERAACRLDLREGSAQQFFFVEGRNDDGNFHRQSVVVFVGCSNLKVCPDKFIPPLAG